MKKTFESVDFKQKALYNIKVWVLALKLDVATSLRNRGMEGTLVEYVLA